MTTIDVREAPAGKAIDEACAAAKGYIEWEDVIGNTVHAEWPQARDFVTAKIWRPSTDIAVAWELVEEMEANGWVTEVNNFSIGWDCQVFYHWPITPATGYVVAHTAPLAICRAFLLAHGITDLEVTGETLGLD